MLLFVLLLSALPGKWLFSDPAKGSGQENDPLLWGRAAKSAAKSGAARRGKAQPKREDTEALRRGRAKAAATKKARTAERKAREQAAKDKRSERSARAAQKARVAKEKAARDARASKPWWK